MSVTFPLGAAAGVSMELNNLTSMANAAACCIVGQDYGGVQELTQMLERSGIPPDLQAQAVEQLATGAGMAYPNLLDPIGVLLVLKKIESSETSKNFNALIPSEIRWGSSIERKMFSSPPKAARDKALALLAKTLYRRLRSQGYEPREMVTLLTQLLGLVTEGIREGD